MQGGNILVVNHALFFSDLALRMAGVNYLPKYDLLILDEAHTVEDVAGDHFGLKVTEGGLRYQLRTLYDTKRGKGMLSTHGSAANDAIRDVVELHDRIGGFLRALHRAGRNSTAAATAAIHEPNWVENDLSPKLRDLSQAPQGDADASSRTRKRSASSPAQADKRRDDGRGDRRDARPEDGGRGLLDGGRAAGRRSA